MGNGNLQRIKVLIASLVAVIAAMVDIYVIVNAPNNYVLLAIVSFTEKEKNRKNHRFSLANSPSANGN